MHEIFYIKGFEEPWWMMDGWEEDVITRKTFVRFEEAHTYFEEMKKELSETYSVQKSKGPGTIAFWNKGDFAYCEECEEDMQVYHGLLWLCDRKPLKSF